MTDIFSPEKRSRVMSSIRSRDTGPERVVRSMLHKMGYRFRLHGAALPGKPDIILSRYRTVIFVHGCFWHRHEGCRYAYAPKSRQTFWVNKFASNVRRDRDVSVKLEQLGWHVLTVWECELRSPDQLAQKLDASLKMKS